MARQVHTSPRTQTTRSGRLDGAGLARSANLDLSSILTRLMADLEQFEAAISVERRRLEDPMPFEQPGRHSERISGSITALVAQLLQVLTLLRELRETEQVYGQAAPRSTQT